jgi:hypothetical protein
MELMILINGMLISWKCLTKNTGNPLMKTIDPELTYEEIAEELKITHQGVQYLEKKALVKLHNLIKSKGITLSEYEDFEPVNDCIRTMPHFDYDGEDTLCEHD